MPRFRKRYLMTPGPTMIPPAVTEARAKQLPHHRTPEFMELIQSIHARLQKIFCTRNEVLSFSASGTGAMEASVASLLSPGDTAICIDAGKFGQRWIELCNAYGIKAVPVTVKRGEAVDPQEVAKALRAHPQAKAVFGQLTETSTGVTLDVKGIAEAVAKTDAVFVIDAISGLGAEELLPDAWKIDVVVGGSQKALMIPPGLSFVSCSEKAWHMVEASTSPRYYFDLKRYRKGHGSGEHPFTPAVGLYIELDEALRMVEAEGIEQCWKRHAWLASATRAAVQALGLQLFSKRHANGLTAVAVPAGIDGSKLVKTMRDVYGVTVAGGQSELKGKIIRIAHLGYVDRFDILAAVSALEMSLTQLGFKLEFGRGVGEALRHLTKEPM